MSYRMMKMGNFPTLVQASAKTMPQQAQEPKMMQETNYLHPHM